MEKRIPNFESLLLSKQQPVMQVERLCCSLQYLLCPLDSQSLSYPHVCFLLLTLLLLQLWGWAIALVLLPSCINPIVNTITHRVLPLYLPNQSHPPPHTPKLCSIFSEHTIAWWLVLCVCVCVQVLPGVCYNSGAAGVMDWYRFVYPSISHPSVARGAFSPHLRACPHLTHRNKHMHVHTCWLCCLLLACRRHSGRL